MTMAADEPKLGELVQDDLQMIRDRGNEPIFGLCGAGLISS